MDNKQSSSIWQEPVNGTAPRQDPGMGRPAVALGPDIHVENLDVPSQGPMPGGRPGFQGGMPGAQPGPGPQGPCFSGGGPVPMPQPVRKQDTPETKNMKENFHFGYHQHKQ